MRIKLLLTRLQPLLNYLQTRFVDYWEFQPRYAYCIFFQFHLQLDLNILGIYGIFELQNQGVIWVFDWAACLILLAFGLSRLERAWAPSLAFIVQLFACGWGTSSLYYYTHSPPWPIPPKSNILDIMVILRYKWISYW